MPTESTSQPEPDFGLISRIPFYFGPEGKKLLGWLHIVKSKPIYDTGVVICQSLGVDYMNSYRPMRYVADYSALAGIPAFRFDYYATGDSSGLNEDRDRLDSWLGGIEDAIRELKKLTECSKIGLIGFRVGATFASLISERTELDFLVLWAACESGRRYIREVKMLQKSAKNQSEENENKIIEAAGMVFGQSTVDSIDKINLLKLKPETLRALIIPRDDLPINNKLKQSWIDAGLEVTQLALPGYTKMVADAHYVEVPHETIAKIISWIKKNVPESAEKILKHESLKNVNKSINIEHHNECLGNDVPCTVIESIITYGPGHKRFAILTEPQANADIQKPIIILSNSGANHRVGPNRLYVLLARELSRKGFRCLRIDIASLGDSVQPGSSEENVVYINNSSNEIRMAMQSFGDDYREQKYIVMGLCSGSYFSFHAALELKDVNIVKCILINPLTFYWQEGMSLESSPTKNFSHWNWYMSAIKSPASWMKMFKGKISFATLTKTLVNRIKIIISSKISAVKLDNFIINNGKEDVRKQNLAANLKDIVNNKTHISFVLSRSDPGYDILMMGAGRVVKKIIRKGAVNIEFIENADHTFSKLGPRCDLIKKILKMTCDSH